MRCYLAQPGDVLIQAAGHSVYCWVSSSHRQADNLAACSLNTGTARALYNSKCATWLGRVRYSQQGL